MLARSRRCGGQASPSPAESTRRRADPMLVAFAFEVVVSFAIGGAAAATTAVVVAAVTAAAVLAAAALAAVAAAAKSGSTTALTSSHASVSGIAAFRHMPPR